MMATMENPHGLIIFAIGNTEDEQEARSVRATLRYHELDPSSLLVAERVHKGVHEQVYVYPFSFKAWWIIRPLALANKQEEITQVMPSWACMLRRLSPEDDRYLGVFTGIPCAVARMMGTYVRIMNQYYYINQGE